MNTGNISEYKKPNSRFPGILVVINQSVFSKFRRKWLYISGTLRVVAHTSATENVLLWFRTYSNIFPFFRRQYRGKVTSLSRSRHSVPNGCSWSFWSGEQPGSPAKRSRRVSGANQGIRDGGVRCVGTTVSLRGREITAAHRFGWLKWHPRDERPGRGAEQRRRNRFIRLPVPPPTAERRAVTCGTGCRVGVSAFCDRSAFARAIVPLTDFLVFSFIHRPIIFFYVFLVPFARILFRPWNCSARDFQCKVSPNNYYSRCPIVAVNTRDILTMRLPSARLVSESCVCVCVCPERRGIRGFMMESIWFDFGAVV